MWRELVEQPKVAVVDTSSISKNYPEYVKNILREDILQRKPSDNVRIAYELANEIHKGEERKGTEKLDYITHPLRVYDLVDRSIRKDGVWSDPMRCAALLHDCIESAGKKFDDAKEKQAAEARMLQEIKEAFPKNDFGEKVAGLVKELTNPIEYQNENGEKISKEEWQVRHVQKISLPARVVKICDQTANLISDIEEGPDWDYQKLMNYRAKTSKVVEAAQENIVDDDRNRHFSLIHATRTYGMVAAYSQSVLDELKKLEDIRKFTDIKEGANRPFAITNVHAIDLLATKEAEQQTSALKALKEEAAKAIERIINMTTRFKGRSEGQEREIW